MAVYCVDIFRLSALTFLQEVDIPVGVVVAALKFVAFKGVDETVADCEGRQEALDGNLVFFMSSCGQVPD